MRKHKQSDHTTFQGLPTAWSRELPGKGVFNAKAKVASLTLGLVKGLGIRDPESVF